MNNDNGDLLQRIIDDRPPEVSEDEQLSRTLRRWYDGRRNVVMARTTFWCLVVLALFLWGARLLTSTTEPMGLIAGAIMILASLQLNIIIKLWYWILDCKISVMKELKLLQQRMLALHEGEDRTDGAEAGPGTAELFPEGFAAKSGSVWEKLSPKAAGRIASVIILAAVVAMLPQLVKLFHPGPSAVTAEQRDEWRLVSPDRMLASTELRLERTPKAGPFITISLPYSAAEVTAVTVDGAPARYAKLDWRRHELELPADGFPGGERVVVVEWALPVQELKRDGNGFRAALWGLVPVRSLHLEVVTEPGSGFVIPDAPSGRARPFWTTISPPRQFFGSCGLLARRSEAGAGGTE